MLAVRPAARGDFAVRGFQDQLAVDVGADARAVVLHLQRVVALRVVGERGGAEFAPVADAQGLVDRKAQAEHRLLAVAQAEQIVVAVGVVAKDDAGEVFRAERLHLQFDGVGMPLRVAGDEQGLEPAGAIGVGDQVLLDVGLAVLVAGDPGVLVDDGVLPGSGGHAAVRQVVILLNGGIEESHRLAQQSGREAGEVVLEQFAGRHCGGDEHGKDERTREHGASSEGSIQMQAGSWRRRRRLPPGWRR